MAWRTQSQSIYHYQLPCCRAANTLFEVTVRKVLAYASLGLTFFRSLMGETMILFIWSTRAANKSQIPADCVITLMSLNERLMLLLLQISDAL